ncbi:pentatricopeptide repeat-containing protein 2, mitochondrial-like [Ischnura elegans]|uniref:pentatricopeptide repeat-containing protein 2, mitochondrial-like n=1 Tax=Ischnura elegans TaxID=197161 RepID=UPI001ED8B498|nr:pentatricopeptide repeat-containing protein 2, mitochondrial-like [Ischnura elegans]
MFCHASRQVLALSLFPIPVNVHAVAARCLFGQAALGIDGYLKTRDRVKVQFLNLADNFRSKMLEFTQPASTNMIFTEDLKSMVHLVENKPADVELLQNMISRFNRQNKELRFGSFIFGPVVMRALHYLNLPDVALKVFKDPELDGFFDQLMSYQILMDLLYKNSMFKEVIEVFDMVQAKQIHGPKYPKNVVILAMAASYKLNTKEQLNYVMNVWKKMLELGHTPVRRAITFAAALAVNQNSPHVAIEILSCTQQPNYVTVRNLKIAALADLGRVEDAFPILRNVIETDVPDQKKQTFSKDVLDKLKRSVEERADPDVVKEFKHLEKALMEGNHLSDSSLDEHLCSEITLANAPGRQSGERNRAGFTGSLHQKPQYNYRNPPPRHYRTSLKDME